MERQFTRQAENALKLAKTTAKTCGHGYIGTEHLLAGLLKEPEGTAGKVLQEFNVEEEKLRELISSLVTPVQGNTAAWQDLAGAPLKTARCRAASAARSASAVWWVLKRPVPSPDAAPRPQ